ncbi:MAG: hypothetical protein RMZ41_024200 [Nostoc sp. DedVER02]|uniref:hypothetical protein n=1 Tax=unclassified Nostoc TaxID=2593658 RepID=UPI002AD4B5F7|nr:MULTISPECIES: hypothetical protein [unclassified Nostoc]MDZ7984644.1 hypothetical protein [Nostoc sp. DedVER02]MDZ8111237.1 hypothetical protein [Nostoc sp. DedVER01b]
MSSYYISPPETTNWQITPDILAKELKGQWNSAKIETIDSVQSIHSLAWILQIDRWRLDGTLTKEGNVVHLDGDVHACARFAIWFRTKVPIEQELIFYDEGYSSDVVIESETIESDLVQPFITS